MARRVEAMRWMYAAGVPVACCLRCHRIQTFLGDPMTDAHLEHLHYYFHHWGPPWRTPVFWDRPRPEGP